MSIPDDHLTRAGLIHAPINTMSHKCSLCGQQWVGAHTCTKMSPIGGPHLIGVERFIPAHPPAESEQHKSLPEGLEPEAPDLALDLQMDLADLLAELASTQADMIRLKVAGYRDREAARQLGVAVSTAKQALKLARIKLKILLSEP